MSEPFPLPYASTDLTGRVALVTGASSGLGRRFALTLAAAGASVGAAARRVDRLEEVAEEIAGNGGSCVPVELDVTDAASIVRAVEQLEAAFGTVRHPRQQRRHPRRPACPQDVRRARRRRDRHQPAGPVPARLRGRPAPHRRREARPHREHLVDGRVPLRRHGRRALLDHEGGPQPDDRDAGRGVGPLRHQRQRHRAGRVPLRDDGRDDVAHRRLHAIPARGSGWATRRSSTARCCTSWRRRRSS